VLLGKPYYITGKESYPDSGHGCPTELKKYNQRWEECSHGRLQNTHKVGRKKAGKRE